MKNLIVTSVVMASSALFGAVSENPSGAVKTAFAVETKTPVVLDGVLDEDVWKAAPRETQLTAMTGLPLAADEDRATDLRFAFDAQHLYVAIVCRVREDLASATKTDEVRRTGGGTWDNVLEVYFDPGRTMNNFTGVWIYSDGTNFGMADYQHRDPAKGIRYASRTEGHVWTVEIAFPAYGRTMAVGGQWGFNLIRYAPGAGILGMWQVIHSAFQTPGSFGRVLLGEPKAWLAANVKKLSDDLGGAEKVLKGGAYTERLAAVRADLARLSALGAQPAVLDAYGRIASDTARLVDEATVKAVVPMTEIKYWSCDDWYWEPFSYADTQRLSKQVAEGEKPTYEYDGPIVRKCEGWYPSIGRACEGVKGTGWRLMPRKDQVAVGVHGSFGGVFSEGRRYKIECWLKGAGSFSFFTLFNSVNLKTGVNDCRCLTVCEGNLNAEWTKFEADYELPPPPSGYKAQKGNPLGISIPAATDFAVDELRIWEL